MALSKIEKLSVKPYFINSIKILRTSAVTVYKGMNEIRHNCTSYRTLRSEATFKKVLIANRGEIACRIIKTARRMGIKTVAVFSKADSQSKHVTLADEAVYIGPSAASKSYLNIERIISAIKKTGAEAVHPGYGFLSENPEFVKSLEKENITFIGPSAEAITEMGDKMNSKRLAKAAGIRTIPGYDGIIKDANHCAEIAKTIGYPAMIKATAGGGGKGMRIARNDDEAKLGFELSTAEALSSFGDGNILLEKFIEEPRHIEIQVLGDKFGNIIHLNERECSIQRRNQKLIEEAPSLILDETARREMGNKAISLCKTIGYSSSGTVEFLVDKKRNFYFLEMNTRLQVEHTITETITGVDIVEEMIRIAFGHRLKLRQEDIRINGWAIESRICAEDPYKNFGTPSVGKIYKYEEPFYLEGFRCDSGIEEGIPITMHYDSIICKVISHGINRKEAIEKNIETLDSFVLRGVSTNIPLLMDVLMNHKFKKGTISTNFLNDIYPETFQATNLEIEEKYKLTAIASALYVVHNIRNQNLLNIQTKNPASSWKLCLILQEEDFEVDVRDKNKHFEVTVANKTFVLSKSELSPTKPVLKIRLGNVLDIVQLLSRNAVGKYHIMYKGKDYKLDILPKKYFNLKHIVQEEIKTISTKIIRSPMPGLIKTISCRVGDIVSLGQELCTIEAMKMQNSIIAPSSGKIKTVNIEKFSTVGDDEILIEIE